MAMLTELQGKRNLFAEILGDGQMAPKPQRAPGKGPWLIWSVYHGSWHRRASDGAAAGYTSDLSQAGIFGREKADEYHERPWKHRRDKAIPVSKKLAEMKQHLAAMTEARDQFAERIANMAAQREE